MKAIIAALALAAALGASSGEAAGQAPARVPEAQVPPAVQTIPFRKDDDVGALMLNVGLGLAVAIGVGVGALYVLRRHLAGVQKAPGRRLRVLETVRLGPKTALVLVEVDGRSLLIGQQADTLTVLSPAAAAAAVSQTAAHDAV